MSPEEFRDKWGDARFVRLDPYGSASTPLPESAKEFLIQSGLPCDTGVWEFTFDLPPNRIPILSEKHKLRKKLPAKYENYLVLGGNDAVFLCAKPDYGTIVSVTKYPDIVEVFINASLSQMAETFLLMRDAIPVVLANPYDFDELKQRLEAEVIRIDPLTTEEGWWSGMIYDLSSFLTFE